MKNKKNLKINLSQFGVWKDLQMIYLLFIFNFLLLIESWALIVGPSLIPFYFYELGPDWDWAGQFPY
jgi:hypothetical protein